MTAIERMKQISEYLDSLIVYQKRIVVGKVNRNQRVAGKEEVIVEVKLSKRQDGGEGLVLSMVGEAPGTFGQFAGRLREEIGQPLISEEQISRMAEIWDRWHLNSLRAGCEHQRAAGTHSAWMGDSGDYSGVRIGYPRCQVCGYSYGSKWLHEDLPAEIVEEVKSW